MTRRNTSLPVAEPVEGSPPALPSGGSRLGLGMWHGVDIKTGERAYGTTLKSDAVTDAAFHAEFHNVNP
jgi:hypothetical protein